MDIPPAEVTREQFVTVAGYVLFQCCSLSLDTSIGELAIIQAVTWDHCRIGKAMDSKSYSVI